MMLLLLLLFLLILWSTELLLLKVIGQAVDVRFVRRHLLTVALLLRRPV